MNSLIRTIQTWDWRLVLSIFIYMLLPRIYDSYSVYLIGNAIPDTNSLPIVAQWSFVALAIEVLQEAMILPLFFFIGGYIKAKDDVLNHIKTSVSVICVTSIALTVILLLFIDRLVDVIGTPLEIQQDTKSYLAIKIISIPFSILAVAAITFAESLTLKKVILLIAVIKVLIAVTSDSLFYGGYSFSLGYGTDGVALSNLITEIIMFLVTLTLVRHSLGLALGRLFTRPFFSNYRVLLRVGSWSGLDSLIRNLAYSYMIVKMLNLIGVQEIGGYYLAMHILWGFLLVPMLAFSESAKVLLANHNRDTDKLKKYFHASLVIALLLSSLLIIAFPFWPAIAGFFNRDVDIVNFSYLAFSVLLIPYVLFVVNTICDSLFYAIGKTQFMAYQSILTNAIVYGTAFLVYVSGTWAPTFTGVMWLFATGILVDSILTGFFAWYVLRNQEKLAL